MSNKRDHPIAVTLKPYFCGGLAAMFASTCTHPIDLAKVRLQLVGEGQAKMARPSTLSVMRDVIADRGVRGLYAGLSASLTRQATYGTARIGLHSVFSEKLASMQGDGAPIPMWKKFISAFFSGAIASAIGNPFDVSLVRMQADGIKPQAEQRGYKGVVDAVTRITKEEGVHALYHGYPPTLLRAIAMNVGMMMTYDQAKETIVAINGEGLVTNLASSAVAGFFCAFLSLPFDMIKTRLQNMKPDANGIKPYTSLGDCASKILRHEGFFAFWHGFGAFYGRCAPHAMVILISREYIFKAYNYIFSL